MNSLKRKDNLFKFERDYENLIELSFKRREEGDYVGALSIMRSLMRTDDNPDVFAHIADIYADMDLYENAVNYWYKFLRYSKKKYYVDAYNGLGANFFLAGNDAVAGYYFNKQLEVGGGEDCVYEDVLEDYFNSLTEAKNSSYKVVYPLPKEKVEEEIYLSGKSFFDSEEYEKAVEKFESVEKGSGFYFKAKDEEAYALFYLNRIEEAYSLIKSLIKEGRKSISILSIAINAAAIIGTEKELGKFIDMLIGYDPDEDEEKYKKLNLLITLNLTDEAFKYSSELLKILKYQSKVYFLRGVLFYNSKDYNKAEESFRFTYILEESCLAEYYLKITESALNGKIVYKKLESSFALPEKETERRIGLIKELYDGYTAKREIDFPVDMHNIADWVFREGNQTLQVALSLVIAYKKEEKYVSQIKDYLISTFISDEVKHRIVSIFCESGIIGELPVVFGYIYRKIKIPEAVFSGAGAAVFTRAHAYAFGRFSVIYDGLSKLKTSAKNLQTILIGNGNADKIDDIPALACVIYKRSGLRLLNDESVVCEFFGTDETAIVKIENLLNNRE